MRLLLLALAGWISRHQQDVIDYLVEENRLLKEQLGGKRLRLTDDQRRRLAAKGKRIGRQALNRVATIVTPDTIMRWHRRLIAQKWTYEARATDEWPDDGVDSDQGFRIAAIEFLDRTGLGGPH